VDTHFKGKYVPGLRMKQEEVVDRNTMRKSIMRRSPRTRRRRTRLNETEGIEENDEARG